MFEKKTGKEVGGEIGLGVLRVKEGEGLPWWSIGKESAFQCRRCGLDPWLGN